MSHRLISGSSAIGASASANVPRNPSVAAKRLWTIAVESGSRAVARRDQRNSFRTVRCRSELRGNDLGDRRRRAEKGPPESKDDDEPPVSRAGGGHDRERQPGAQLTRSVGRRPKRSAIPATGSAPSDAKRITVSPSPNSVPERPACSVTVAPRVRCPKVLATSPSVATAPNCPNPAANASRATLITPGLSHPRSRIRGRAGRSFVTCVDLPFGPVLSSAAEPVRRQRRNAPVRQ